jgi:imidazolonepropionase-like amidohydrolase
MSEPDIKKITSGYIWVPRALTGNNFSLRINLLLEIRNGLIISMQHFPASKLSELMQPDKPIFCLSPGTTLIPALIDAHVHLALDGCGSNSTSVAQGDFENKQKNVNKKLKECLGAGIGSLRDGGDFQRINLRLGKKGKYEGVPIPQIVATGEALRRENNYGTILGRGYSSTDQIESIIDHLFREGIDQLKVIVSGVVSFEEYGTVSGLPPDYEELAFIVRSAHRRRLKVMAHASSDYAVRIALQAGVDSVEHGYYVSTETLKTMAEKDIAWVPTVIPVAVHATGCLAFKHSLKQREVITRIYQEHLEKMVLAPGLGIRLGVGTDAGAPGVKHGIDLVNEMLLYSECPLSNKFILQAATSINAGITGLDKKVGSIKVGYEARLIAVYGNPLDDLDVLKNVRVHFLPG